MSNVKLPAEIAAETCLDYLVSVPVIARQPSAPNSFIPEYCTEPHVVVFEKLREPVDERSLEILRSVFNLDGQQAIDMAVLAKVREQVHIMKTDFDTASFKIELVEDELNANRISGAKSPALNFSALPVSALK